MQPGHREIQACFISAESGHHSNQNIQACCGRKGEGGREHRERRKGEERENGKDPFSTKAECLWHSFSRGTGMRGKWLLASGVLAKPSNQTVSCSDSTDVAP